MKRNPLISVIIPVYNVEEYLEECLNSVINQTYKNLEVILVNDNSPDKSGEIINRYLRLDDRIKAINKQVNEGLNCARKDGIKSSSGDYIVFLDSDDLLHDQTIEIYVRTLLESGADVVVAGFFDFSKETQNLQSLVSSKEERGEVRLLKSKKEIISYALLGKPNFPDANYMTACGKIYKKTLIKNIDWHKSNFRSYEDNFWTPQALMGADKIALISSNLYFYRRDVRDTSGSSSLGNRLTGNSLNGKPVGYLEYLSLLHDFHIDLSKQYGTSINKDLEVVNYQWSWNRLCVLIDAELLGAENNMQYVKPIWIKHQAEDWKTQQRIAELNEKIQESNSEYTRLKQEVEHLSGIRASARHLLGNIKKRISRP